MSPFYVRLVLCIAICTMQACHWEGKICYIYISRASRKHVYIAQDTLSQSHSKRPNQQLSPDSLYSIASFLSTPAYETCPSTYGCYAQDSNTGRIIHARGRIQDEIHTSSTGSTCRTETVPTYNEKNLDRKKGYFVTQF